MPSLKILYRSSRETSSLIMVISILSSLTSRHSDNLRIKSNSSSGSGSFLKRIAISISLSGPTKPLAEDPKRMAKIMS